MRRSSRVQQEVVSGECLPPSGVIDACDFSTVLDVSATWNHATVVAPESRGWMETISVPDTEAEGRASTRSGMSPNSASLLATEDFVEL